MLMERSGGGRALNETMLTARSGGGRALNLLDGDERVAPKCS